MLVGHFSDLHGNLNRLLASSEKPDVWVNSGDFFPDDPLYPYGTPKALARKYQKVWFLQNRPRFLERLGGAPLLTLGGNHDSHDLYSLLRHLYPVHSLDLEPVEVGGLRWAGFGQTPLDTPRFVLDEFAERVVRSQPDVLVTHAPPSEVLCGGHSDWGLEGLEELLSRSPRPPRVHLFGHIHPDGGRDQTAAYGTRYYNGACRVRFIEV